MLSQVGRKFGRLTIQTQPERKTQYKCRCVCECGAIVAVYYYSLRDGHTKSCGCWNRERASNQRGDQRYNWKGGRKTDGRGYIDILLPDGTYRKEHILVVERRLGRKLFPDETVHHKNGIRDDNTEANLELRVRAKHPSGASVKDLIEWAYEIIKRYEAFPTLWHESVNDRSSH